MNYIAEANKFMYDDNYVVETKVKVDGKEFASKKAAEENLEGKGLTHKQIADKLNKAINILNNKYQKSMNLWSKHKRAGNEAEAAKHDSEAKKHSDEYRKLVSQYQDHLKNKNGKSSSLSKEKINKHLEDAKLVHKFHTEGGGEKETWAHDNQDYDPHDHKDTIDRIEKHKKQGTSIPDHLVKSMIRHNKNGAHAYQEIQGQTMGLNHYYHKKSLEG